VSEPSRTRRRHHRRWWKRKTPRRLLLLGGVVVLLAVAWTAWSGFTVFRELTAARSAAQDLEASLREQDADASQRALNRLQHSSAVAADWTDGPTWSALSVLPVVGGDVDAVRRMSAALADISGEGLSPLVRALKDFEAGRYDPTDGRLPLDRIEALEPRLERSQQSFDRANEALGGITDGLRVGRVESARAQLVDAVEDGLDRLRPARRAVSLLPPMLGADGPRTYLLVLQNNAEIRSTGGFAGSTFQLTADDGDISLEEPVAGNTFEFLESPGLSLSDEERALFTDRAATRFVDANFIPDFPRAAELWRTRYESRFDVTLDGVVTADPVALSYLLEGSDPIEVQGVSLTSDNVVQELLSTTYSRFEDPADQDEFFRQAGTLIFDRLLTDPDPATLVDGLRRGLDEGRVAVVSALDDEQEALVDAGATGALRPDAEGVITAGVYLNDTTADTGSKLSYYLDHRASVDVTCGSEGVSMSGSLDLRSTLVGDPAALPDYVTAGSEPNGAEGLTLFLLAPEGGTLSQVALDGQPVEVVTATYRGSPAARVELVLPPAGARQLTWTMTAPEAGTGAAPDEVLLEVTPGVQPRQASGVFPTGCR